MKQKQEETLSHLPTYCEYGTNEQTYVRVCTQSSSVLYPKGILFCKDAGTHSSYEDNHVMVNNECLSHPVLSNFKLSDTQIPCERVYVFLIEVKNKICIKNIHL